MRSCLYFDPRIKPISVIFLTYHIFILRCDLENVVTLRGVFWDVGTVVVWYLLRLVNVAVLHGHYQPGVGCPKCRPISLVCLKNTIVAFLIGLCSSA